MSWFLNTLKNEGEDVLRKSALLLAASAICVMALTFFAGAIAVGASNIMPPYAALLLAGLFLSVVAVILLILSNRHGTHEHHASPSAIDQSTLDLIAYNAHKSPTKMLLAGLAAGATLGLLEAFEQRRH